MDNKNTMIQNKLFMLQDLSYKEFHSKLMPTINPDVIIGVRTPQMRAFAKEVFKQGDYYDFLSSLPHKYYEENNLHGFILEQINDYDELIQLIDRFLPYIDNWATCDFIAPKIFKKNTDKLIGKIKVWLKSSHTYTIRFGVNMLMKYYLDEHFSDKYLSLVADIKNSDYYIMMGVAWYFATALAKQYDATIPYIENKALDTQTHNKAIQKAIESRRIPPEQKEYLKTLKIK